MEIKTLMFMKELIWNIITFLLITGIFSFASFIIIPLLPKIERLMNNF